MKVTHFNDGEIRVQVEESARGTDVFIIQPTCGPVQRQPDGTADHDRRLSAGVGGAHHGRAALLRLRATGQKGQAARTRDRAPGRRPHHGSGRDPRGLRRSACRTDSGLFPHPDGPPVRRSPDRRASHPHGPGRWRYVRRFARCRRRDPRKSDGGIPQDQHRDHRQAPPPNPAKSRSWRSSATCAAKTAS